MLRFTENVIIQMTRDCNMRCKYCYEGHNRAEWKNKYIDHETFKKIVDTAIYYRCILGRVENPINFHFHGGEVLLVPWEELKKDIEYLQMRKTVFPGISWCMQSNGLGITEEIARYFSQRGISFGISYDGRHATGRMTPSATDAFVHRLKQLNTDYGLRFSSLSVITKENMKDWLADMQEVDDFFDSYGMNFLCPDYTNEDIVPTPEEQWVYCYKPVLETFLTPRPLKERNLLTILQIFVEKKLFGLPKLYKTGCFDKLCGYGANMTSISPDLKAHPCDKFLEEGIYREMIDDISITKKDFLGLQQTLKTCQFYEQMFKLFDQNHCHSCPVDSMCAGDCQVFNISKLGHPQIDSSLCQVRRNIYNFLEEHWWEILQNLSITLSAKIGDVVAVLPSTVAELEKHNLRIEYDMSNNSVFLVPNEV